MQSVSCVSQTAGACVVFATATKDSTTITMDTLKQICEAVSIPVVAIGGMTAENVPEALQAGCAGVAVVSAIFGVADAKASATQLRQAITTVSGD